MSALGAGIMLLVRSTEFGRASAEVLKDGKTMEIPDWRKEIDELDEQIVSLISKRAEAARAIGLLKKNAAQPIYEPKREQEVFDHVRSINPGPLGDTEMLHVYERIIDVMRTLQRQNTPSKDSNS